MNAFWRVPLIKNRSKLARRAMTISQPLTADSGRLIDGDKKHLKDVMIPMLLSS